MLKVIYLGTQGDSLIAKQHEIKPIRIEPKKRLGEIRVKEKIKETPDIPLKTEEVKKSQIKPRDKSKNPHYNRLDFSSLGTEDSSQSKSMEEHLKNMEDISEFVEGLRKNEDNEFLVFDF